MVVGILLIILALFMAPPMVADMAAGHPDWQVFLVAGSVTLFIGVSLVLMNRAPGFGDLTGRQAFLLTTVAWLALALFAALPFAFCELQLGPADAVFEAMSGITTTGATVIAGLDAAPPGILLWRAILQWLGGIGIIVMGVAILPMLSIGGMQLVRAESSDLSEKILPRAAQLASAIGLIYLGLTLICAILYWYAGMLPFDAAAHAMTTIATGGYSTSRRLDRRLPEPGDRVDRDRLHDPRRPALRALHPGDQRALSAAGPRCPGALVPRHPRRRHRSAIALWLDA